MGHVRAPTLNLSDWPHPMRSETCPTSSTPSPVSASPHEPAVFSYTQIQAVCQLTVTKYHINWELFRATNRKHMQNKKKQDDLPGRGHNCNDELLSPCMVDTAALWMGELVLIHVKHFEWPLVWKQLKKSGPYIRVSRLVYRMLLVWLILPTH